MVKVKATLQAKPKRTEQLELIDREDLLKKIQAVFNIDRATITFMKPQLKDQEQFQKNIKEGIEILFKGNEKKEQTEQEKKQAKRKQQQHARALEEAKKKVEEMFIDPHKKIIDKLTKLGIKQRGFSYMNENNQIQNLHTDHYTSVVHLLRIAYQFKRFCYQYKVQPKNPDGLIIEELAKVFKSIESEPEKLVDPLQWCSSFIAYCADDIDYPYPTYDFNYIIPKILQTIQNAHLTEAERKQPNTTPSLFGPGNSLFGLQMNLKKKKLTKLDEDDYEVGKVVDKKEIRYIIQSDLSLKEDFSPKSKTIEQGIRARFANKIVWQNFYAFDIEYEEEILNIERLPKYLFIHLNRVGYPPSKDESEEIILLPNAKSNHKIRTKMILDMTDFCSPGLKDRIENGKFQRYQLFHRLGQEEGYQKFISDLKSKNPTINVLSQFTDNQLKYMYFDEKLFENDIFHQYYFDQLKGSKQTGEYRIIGVVFHKGKYYHHIDPSHKNEEGGIGHEKTECRGEFMVMVYKHGSEWLKFYHGEVEKVTLKDVLDQKYWGDGEWTPALCLYRQICIKNIEIEIPDDD